MVPQKLADFFDAYQINGPGWNAQERAFATDCLSAALEIAAGMFARDTGRMLSLIGQTSTGKTMMAKLLRKFWNRCVPPHRSTFHHASYINWPSHEWQDLDNERDSPMLVIDEVGRGERGKNGQEWGRLMDVINFRQERGLWTVMGSNLNFAELKLADPALASRLRRHEGIILQAGEGVRPFEERGAL